MNPNPTSPTASSIHRSSFILSARRPLAAHPPSHPPPAPVRRPFHDSVGGPLPFTGFLFNHGLWLPDIQPSFARKSLGEHRSKELTDPATLATK